jgi:xylulokinase
MNEILLMSIDLGTSFIKVAVYDTDSNCVALAFEPVKDERPRAGVFIQRGDDLFASVLNCIHTVCKALEDKSRLVEAISFTGQMSGFMGVDKDWNDITTWSCSLDNRYMPFAEAQMKWLKKKFLKISGTNIPQMASKYEWFKTDFPEENAKIAKYLMISGYVIGRLGGIDIEEAIIDTTYTAWTGLVDISKRTWSKEILDAVGLHEKYLPRIVTSNHICGYLSSENAHVTGLKSGIPLVSGAGDKMAGCLGTAGVAPGELVFETSSYGEITYCAKKYRPDIETGRYDCLLSPVQGYFHPAKFVAGSGITYDWFVENFIRREGEKLPDAFARIEDLADQVEIGCGGLMAIGLLGGSSMPLDGNLRGLFMGFDWSHKPEHFYRGLMESYSFDFALSYDRIAENYPDTPVKYFRVTGGGMNSKVWMQMSADITGVPHHIMDRNDAAMWGAAILAGNAVGIFDDMQKTAEAHVNVKKIYEPNPKMNEKYTVLKGLYDEQVRLLSGNYIRIKEIHDQLAAMRT